jgi:hypothetical protein
MARRGEKFLRSGMIRFSRGAEARGAADISKSPGTVRAATN